MLDLVKFSLFPPPTVTDLPWPDTKTIGIPKQGTCNSFCGLDGNTMSTNIFENSFLPNIFVQNPAFGCNYTRTTSSLDSDEKEQNTFISIIDIYFQESKRMATKVWTEHITTRH